MWGPLLQLFPSLAALGRLMYGDASSIVFNEAGVGRTYLLSSVGTRQGCSWGNFLYCLTIQPLLQQLADEFPDCKVLAFADDVNTSSARLSWRPKRTSVGVSSTGHYFRVS